MSWSCSSCRSEVDDEIDLCWNCGSGIDGDPPSAGWWSEHAALPDGSEREIPCLRCSTPMSHLGRTRLHGGSSIRHLFLGELFVNRDAFDTYGCSTCGRREERRVGKEWVRK